MRNPDRPAAHCESSMPTHSGAFFQSCLSYCLLNNSGIVVGSSLTSSTLYQQLLEFGQGHRAAGAKVRQVVHISIPSMDII